ncbi:hypothetical protein KIPB_011594 [Kipferlia bialata]|uniref:MRH domain-containing protein n=1 Tax=Kipferlia bialata TaxID=797122 RepID=A0A9K3GN96_9EUKA|nr:hypothetical protein KIPB_011594 [Kipferlia bialata]|eukprot:g11594.t1
MDLSLATSSLTSPLPLSPSLPLPPSPHCQYWACGTADVVYDDHPAGATAGFTATYTDGRTPGSTNTRNTVVYFTCPTATTHVTLPLAETEGGVCYLADAQESGWFNMGCDARDSCECDPQSDSFYYVLEYTTEAACPVPYTTGDGVQYDVAGLTRQDSDYVIMDVETFMYETVGTRFYVNVNHPLTMVIPDTDTDSATSMSMSQSSKSDCDGAGVCSYDGHGHYLPLGDVVTQFSDHPAASTAGVTATYTGTYGKEIRTSTVYFTCPGADAPSLSIEDSGMCYRAEAAAEGWFSAECDTLSPCQCGVEAQEPDEDGEGGAPAVTYYVLEFTTQAACPTYIPSVLWWGWVLVGVGVVAVLLGAYFWYRSSKRTKSLRQPLL